MASSGTADPYKSPELALLALNAAAITALTAFWGVLIKSDASNFDLAFIFFALGAMAAVYAAYCRAVAATRPTMHGPLRRLWLRLSPRLMGASVLLAAILVLIAIALPPGTSAEAVGLVGLSVLLTIPVILRQSGSDGSLTIQRIRRIFLGLALALFAGGVMLAAGTLAHRQARDLLTEPGNEAPTGTTKAAPRKGDRRDGFKFGGGSFGGGGASGSFDAGADPKSPGVGNTTIDEKSGNGGQGGTIVTGSGPAPPDSVNLTVICSARSGPPQRIVHVVPRTRPTPPAAIACPAAARSR